MGYTRQAETHRNPTSMLISDGNKGAEHTINTHLNEGIKHSGTELTNNLNNKDRNMSKTKYGHKETRG